MKESYIEGLANHDDPKSCTVTRESYGEALAGAHTGAVLSREIKPSRVQTPLCEAESNTGMTDNCEVISDPTRSKTRCTCGTSLRENREIPCLPSNGSWAASKSLTGAMR